MAPSRVFSENRAMHAYTCPEPLEDRIAPAKLIDAFNVTYRDIDGDKVTITASAPIFTEATVNSVLKFSTGSVNGSTAPKQALWEIDLTALATPAPDGLDLSVTANGASKANVGFIDADTDLGTVRVDGDLGRIHAGDTTTTTKGLESLHVDSMGQSGLKTQAPGANLVSIFLGGADSIEVTRGVTNATLLALGDEFTMEEGTFGEITIGLNLTGTLSAFSGSVVATGAIGSVEVHGNLVGGPGSHTGYIGYANGSIIDAPDLFASGGAVGSVKIGGTVRGGAGSDSGTIATISVGSISVGGDVLGSKGVRSGYLYASGGMGVAEIGGNVVGGSGEGSGRVENNDGGLDHVFVGGKLTGGKGDYSGTIYSDSDLGMVVIDGNVTGNAGLESGSVSAYGSIRLVHVGGNLTSGTGKNSSRISADDLLDTVIIGGNVKGTAANPAWITGGGIVGDDTAAVAYVSVGGNVEYTNFGAGFGNDQTTADNPDALFRELNVMGNWRASNVLAGVIAGADNLFGTSDDAVAPGGPSRAISTIGRVSILGKISATGTSTDHFGFVAELIQQVSIGGKKLPTTAGAGNDALPIPGVNDMTLFEIGAGGS
jgi:hypothetical protein